ncbi:hypothetical protein FB45DRAFT_879353 [Roridomyces roridus]|uniref:Uncharacterized protein n=1 Tax=Roridomyces roridus TaxID=1738132 RepID=A0AAD7F6S0_9AGAR|nr:hypothetical protein FB45DRAFT_879353 [Roridomyces roridus]
MTDAEQSPAGLLSVFTNSQRVKNALKTRRSRECSAAEASGRECIDAEARKTSAIPSASIGGYAHLPPRNMDSPSETARHTQGATLRISSHVLEIAVSGHHKGWVVDGGFLRDIKRVVDGRSVQEMLPDLSSCRIANNTMDTLARLAHDTSSRPDINLLEIHAPGYPGARMRSEGGRGRRWTVVVTFESMSSRRCWVDYSYLRKYCLIATTAREHSVDLRLVFVRSEVHFWTDIPDSEKLGSRDVCADLSASSSSEAAVNTYWMRVRADSALLGINNFEKGTLISVGREHSIQPRLISDNRGLCRLEFSSPF